MPSGTRYPLAWQLESPSFLHESIDKHTSTIVSRKIVYSPAAMLFDEDPDALEDTFDFQLDATFAELI